MPRHGDEEAWGRRVVVVGNKCSRDRERWLGKKWVDPAMSFQVRTLPSATGSSLLTGEHAHGTGEGYLGEGDGDEELTR